MPAGTAHLMMDKMKQKIILVLLFCMSSFLLTHAQPSLQTTIDKNAILIGSQFKLKVQASFQQEAFFVRWLTLPDSLQHFEVIDKTTIDSIYTNDKLTGLAQTFTLTSFDSGKWLLPSFNIKFNSTKAAATLDLFTDSLPVTVAFQKDTSTILRDIKAIREVEVTDKFWYWIAGSIALLLLLLAVWLYFRKKKGKPFSPARSAASAYRNAMNELEKLKQLNLSAPADIKTYHSRLAEILKQYLSDKKGIGYGSKTTGDLLILLKENNIDQEQLSKTATALRCSDAVKFAKYLPGQMESDQSFQSIKQIIEITEQSNTNNKQ